MKHGHSQNDPPPIHRALGQNKELCGILEQNTTQLVELMTRLLEV